MQANQVTDALGGRKAGLRVSVKGRKLYVEHIRFVSFVSHGLFH